jgi:hypothetical protein
MIDKYLSSVPSDLVHIMHSLGERKESWGILFMMADRKEYTLKEIARWFPDLSKNVIREMYMKPLIAAGLLQHNSPSLIELVDHERSIYTISSLGERFLKVMELALEMFQEPVKKSAVKKKSLRGST